MAGFFDTLFGGGAEKEAADKNKALYAQYGTLGTGYLDTGLAGSKDALAQAKAEYNPYSQAGQGALAMLGNAYGLNGASGNAAASSAFTTAPGYQQGIDAGLTAINRRRAAGGMLDSGNADLDALTFAQNGQNQQYQNWLTGLTGLSNTGLTAASGQSGVDTNLANLYQTDATNRVGLQGNVTSGDASANVLQAQGEAAGAKNLLGAGLSLASLAAGGVGGGLGGMLGGSGGMGSALGSLGIKYGTAGAKGSNLFGPLAP
jgi:hypothetical protein